MQRRAHNSNFPELIIIHGKSYFGPTNIYQTIKPKPQVNLNTFMGRMRKLQSIDNLNEKEILEALYTPTSEYMKKYAVRKSWIIINGKKIDLLKYYKENQNPANVDYPTFRSRLKKSKLVEESDKEILIHAITFSTDQWISFYGGGRHRYFTYYGELYPDLYGHKFHGISAFLRKVNRYSEKELIWSRLKSGWDIDSALSIPVDFNTNRKGRIYKITRISTGQIYIGLTFSSIKQRWKFHLYAANKNAQTKLAKAIRKDGPAGFRLETLEDDIDSPSTLKEREKYWVLKFNSRGPNGLNTAPPGGLGSSKGVPVIFEGESFDSITEAGYVLGKRYNIPSFTVERCIRDGVKLPIKTRKHSKHKDAGSNLFRRWLALKKRHEGNIVPKWLDSYDCFKKDVGNIPKKDMRLIRKNNDEPWGPSNFYWGNSKELVESIHGKEISVNGKKYSSIKALSDEFGIGYSTLKNRINIQKLPPRIAVKLPIGPTGNKKN
ncbi:MAG: GIY-YIG nuclease family protein [Mariniphaga sp.]